FGGMSLSAGTYNAIARPLGILYLFILSVCPLLSWGKTDGARFLKRARIPALFALVLFIVLMVYFFTTLLPAYNSTISSGGVLAQGLLDEGPSFYYNGLAVIGFLVASLLFFNALFMLGRNVGRYAKAHDINVFAAFFAALKNKASTYGGFISHLAMSIILVGLIGSSMYVSERTDIVSYIEETDSAANDFHIKDYTLKYKDNNIEVQNEGEQVFYTVRFDVYKNGEYQKTVAPTIQVVQTTMQQRLIAGVSSFPTEDLFVVYRGVNDAGAFTLDVKINRLISFVWVGFGLLMIGALVSTIGRRPSLAKISDSDEDDNVGNVVEAEAEIEVDGAVVAEAEVELEAKAETKAKTKSTSAQSKKKPKSSDDLIQEAKEVLETTEKTAEKAAEKTAPKKPAPKKPAAKKPTEKASAKDKKDTKA
ncbi:MAG: hypothetical protein LBB35_00475, partial [Coriobacteriaceae bacterium]|nr:hypothetical protein [Coriobacteriaceae bacterium]